MDGGTHLLYVLLDSNLPTGGFVASSGLESWAKHGFLSFDPDPEPVFAPRASEGQLAVHSYNGSTSLGDSSGGDDKAERDAYGKRPANPAGAAAGVTDFARAEIENYHSTTGAFVKGAWEAVSHHLAKYTSSASTSAPPSSMSSLEGTLQKLLSLDKYHEASMLSHVSRRASKSQGVAMLTLYTKGLSQPIIQGQSVSGRSPAGLETGTKGAEAGNDAEARRLVDAYKLMIRKAEAPGHLAVCWGIMTAALDIPLEQANHLHLFLHARSLLSAAVRLNLIGPYLSSQLLLHPFKSIIDRAAAAPLDDLVTSTLPGTAAKEMAMGYEEEQGQEEDPWAWTQEAESGPATTWPLGELLMARHDLQHSRIFNS